MTLAIHRAPWTSQPPQGTPATKDFAVYHAAIGGTFFDSALGTHEDTATGTAFTSGAFGEFGSHEAPGAAPQTVCVAQPGSVFVILAVIKAGSLSGVQQIIALDPSASPSGLRTFQFRTNDANVDFIRFNTAASPFTASAALGLSAGQSGCVLAWSNGLSFGLITPGGAASDTMTGTPKPWGDAQGYARWFSRRTTGVNDPSTHGTYLRAVVDDPGTPEGRHALWRNPWRVFEPLELAVPYEAAGGGLPTIGTPFAVDLTATSFRPAVPYTY